ncbi:MAG: DNA polymerase III subunit gamma/tau, partial [Spirochaetaceae bacterium]|nr:DNA polymerase III subunit gamma/tau [Spirochaetaceae bacterium]
FDSLAGQDFVVATLKNSLQSGHIAHAYLFSGPRGVGKTSAARILAKSLNCLGVKAPTAEPCGSCENCVGISRGASLDVIEIDGATNTGVNDVRQIKDEVLFAPGGSRYKVYIIDEVHQLSSAAFNALLKTIEEPPPYIVFIFATTEIQKVPATIRSRCQQFSFRRITLETTIELLKNLCAELSLVAEDDALLWIAKEATGSLRDAYMLFDQVASFSGGTITLAKIRDKLGFAGLDRLNGLCELFADGKTGESLLFLDELLSAGVSPEQFVADMTEYFRNILWIKNGIRREALLGYNADGFSPRVVAAWETYQIEKALALLFELHRNLRYSPNQRFEIELVLARLSDLKNYITPQQLLARVAALRKELKTGFTLPAGAAQAGEASEGEQGRAAPGETADGFPEDPAAEDGEVPVRQRNAIIQHIRKKKVTLASYLEKAPRWHREGGVLKIVCATKFAADFIRGDLAAVETEAGEVLGSKIRVEIREDEKTPEPAKKEEAPQEEDRRVEMARKVFRGEVIK